MIKAEGLTKFYGKTRGIENLDLSIEKGQIFGLLGPNGAGKTTTLRLIMGLLKPSKGTVSIKGNDCWKQSVNVKKISGYIPGDVRLYPNETGASLINTFAGIRKNKKLADNLIKRFDFEPGKKIKALSRGNRQKLAIILAFMFEPEILVLDEPTSGLDPLMQQEFYAVTKEFQEKGTTVLISSHFLPEVEKICEKVGIVKDGKLVGTEDVGLLTTKHLRRIDITFDKKPTIANYKLPEIVEFTNIFNNHYRIKVKGQIDPVIKALSKDKIKDLSFEHATLEEIFLEYYS